MKKVENPQIPFYSSSFSVNWWKILVFLFESWSSTLEQLNRFYNMNPKGHVHVTWVLWNRGSLCTACGMVTSWICRASKIVHCEWWNFMNPMLVHLHAEMPKIYIAKDAFDELNRNGSLEEWAKITERCS